MQDCVTGSHYSLFLRVPATASVSVLRLLTVVFKAFSVFHLFNVFFDLRAVHLSRCGSGGGGVVHPTAGQVNISVAVVRIVALLVGGGGEASNG